MHLTGGYLFINDFIKTCLVDPNSIEANDKEKMILTFLSDIPEYPLNSIEQANYSDEIQKIKIDIKEIYSLL